MPENERRIIVSAHEPWSTLRLDDGTEIVYRLSSAIVECVPGLFAPDGTPVYNVIWAPPSLVVRAPRELMRPSPQPKEQEPDDGYEEGKTPPH